MATISFRCAKNERDWVEHAAKLAGVSLVEYVKRAVNEALVRQGVDAVLIKENVSERLLNLLH